MESKIITVSLNLNPKYLHKDMIKTHIEDLLNKNVLNGCFHDLGKVIRINKTSDNSSTIFVASATFIFSNINSCNPKIIFKMDFGAIIPCNIKLI